MSIALGTDFQVLPPLSEADYCALKQDIAERGVLVPVEYDDAGNVLDGHHRVQACGELGITDWLRIVRHGLTDHQKRRHARSLNLARRHLNGEQKRELIAAQLLDTPELSDRKLADDLGVSDHTVASVRRETLSAQNAQSQPRVDRNGVVRVMPVARRSYSFIGGDNDPKLIVTKHTGEFEWFTPAATLAAARSVLGGIDLDPASTDEAQRTVNATTYYTRETDGLAQNWAGRVWLNPPYAAELVGKFVSKLVSHVQSGDISAAIMLVDNRTDTAWFHEAAAACTRICFTRGRLRFLRPGGEPGSPLNGSAFFYYGDNPSAFERVFRDIGLIVHTVGGAA